MPFEVINYGKQNDKAGDVIEAFVIPTNINLLAPHLDSGKAALEEAGDGLASILTEYGCVDGKSLVTKSFKLQKCKSISYLIHSVITLSDKNTAGLKESIVLYYKSSLAAVKNKKIKSLIIPIFYFEDIKRNLNGAYSVRIAFEEVAKFLEGNPDVKIFLRCESQECEDHYQIWHRNQNITPNQTILKNMKSHSPAHVIEKPQDEPLQPKQVRFSEDEIAQQRITDNPWLVGISSSLLNWHDFSSTKIENVLKLIDTELEEDKKIEARNKLKFYLGPDLYKIDCDHERGKAGDIQWKRYMLICKLKLLKKLVESVHHSKDYYSYHYVIYEMKRFDRTDVMYTYNIILAMYDYQKLQEWKDNSIIKDFLAANLKEVIELKKKYQYEIVESSSFESKKLINGILGYLYCKSLRKSSLVELTFPEKLGRRIAEKYKKEFEGIITANYSDPAKLISIFESEIVTVTTQIESLEFEIEKLFDSIVEKKKKEIIKYITDTVMAIKEDNSPETIETINKTLINVVNFNNAATLMMKDGVLIKFYNELDKNNPLKALLESYLIKAEYRSLISAVTNFNSGNLSSAYLVSIPELSQNPMFENILSWNELNNFLSYIVCKSELQHIFRAKLEAYTAERINSTYFQHIVGTIYGTESVIESRIFVSYLAGCLFLASANETDSGILFGNTEAKFYEGIASRSVGINYIIEELEKKRTHGSRLKMELIKILREIHSGTYVYLEKDEKQTMVVDEVSLFHKAISKSSNLRPSYTKAPDQYESLLSLGLFGCGNFTYIPKKSKDYEEVLTTKQRCL